MQNEIHNILLKLSSKSVMTRRQAITELRAYLYHKDAYLARLSLHYVSEHDPSHTVRVLAKRAFYDIGQPPTDSTWERTHTF